MLAPSVNEAPLAGLLTVTAGAALAATVTVITSEPLRPPESVTVAVIVCVPILNTAEKAPPAPIAPSRLEVHDRLALRSPSSASVADAANAMLAPSVNEAPLAGLLIVTAGATLAATVTLITSEADRPPESVTVAVIACVPTLNTAEKPPPVPIAPSRLDVHDKLAVTSPSSSSLAEAANAMLTPSVNEAPLAGPLIATAGATLADPAQLPHSAVELPPAAKKTSALKQSAGPCNS